ncbi:hypothetical protein J4G37_22495 [Microvirga sp. 3-52]|nr:hypothetical protein [Microvirga sp. 3-52]
MSLRDLRDGLCPSDGEAVAERCVNQHVAASGSSKQLAGRAPSEDAAVASGIMGD